MHWALFNKTHQIANTCRRRAGDGRCELRVQKGIIRERHCTEFGYGKEMPQEQEYGVQTMPIPQGVIPD